MMKCNYVVLGMLCIIHVGVLKMLLEQSSSSVNSQVLLEMQSDILLIISCICELDVHRKVSVCTYTKKYFRDIGQEI